MEYEGYLEVVPTEELKRQRDTLVHLEAENRSSRETIEQELARRDIEQARADVDRIFSEDYISPEVVGE